MCHTVVEFGIKIHIFFFFNLSDKIATGSFDKTCKLWSVETGKCYHTFRGHTSEIVSIFILFIVLLLLFFCLFCFPFSFLKK